jgi:dTDP-4-dehydrorhamnose reductase
MSKPLIVVTGVSGQLGNSILQLSANYQQYQFLFPAIEELDLSKPATVENYIKQYQPYLVINCAAYTAVDKAETEQELCLNINANAPAAMAKACKAINAAFITISTDYVFNGQGTEPYKTNHAIEPVNYYGYSKALMEKWVIENNADSIIVRTSWVYCEHGHNFVKTMLRLMKEKTTLNVVNDQVGCPTYAPNLAKALLDIATQLNTNKHRGIYHYSNTGNISWFQFATAIRDMAQLNCTVNPVPSTAYPTPAKRPAYSVLDTSDITKDFGIAIIDWKESLKICIDNLLK